MSEFNLQRIGEHDRSGRWRKAPPEWNSEGFTRNPLCGDEIRVKGTVSEDVIITMRFHGQGCMVSQACASMLCEGVEGKSIEEVLRATPEELMEFEIRELTMNRQRCALIAYEALMNALADYRVDNSDENTRGNDSRTS